MYSVKSYQLTLEEFNYLLPVLKSKMLSRGDKYYFIGSVDDLSDMLNKLKGMYNKYDDLNHMISYNCFKDGSIIPFRTEIGVVCSYNN